jgi:hypothetical protein
LAKFKLKPLQEKNFNLCDGKDNSAVIGRRDAGTSASEA